MNHGPSLSFMLFLSFFVYPLTFLTAETKFKVKDASFYTYSLDLNLSTKDGRTFPISIKPSLELHLDVTDCVIGDFKLDFRVLTKAGDTIFYHKQDIKLTGKASFNLRVQVEKNKALCVGEAYQVHVCLSNDRDFDDDFFIFRYQSISGVVTDFDEKPPGKKAYVLFERGEYNDFVLGVETDEVGRYQTRVPQGYYHTIWAVCEDFGHDSLERYAHHVTIDADVKLNFRIHRLEIYRLTAAVTTERTLLADFTLFTVHYTLDKFLAAKEQNKALTLRDTVHDLNFYPELSEKNVRLFVDNEPVDILHIGQRFATLKPHGELTRLRPYWTIEADIPKNLSRGRHTLKVVIKVSATNQGRLIYEQGEASHHDLIIR